jgi:hypothetical protein
MTVHLLPSLVSTYKKHTEEAMECVKVTSHVELRAHHVGGEDRVHMDDLGRAVKDILKRQIKIPPRIIFTLQLES